MAYSNLLRALAAFSGLPPVKRCWKPARIIDITATKPAMRSKISIIASATAKTSFGKLNTGEHWFKGSGATVRYSHQCGKKLKNDGWTQPVTAKSKWVI